MNILSQCGPQTALVGATDCHSGSHILSQWDPLIAAVGAEAIIRRSSLAEFAPGLLTKVSVILSLLLL